MKKYDLHKIMKEAHKIMKYIKLYSVTHGVKNWADCLRLSWANEKKRVADEVEREAMNKAFSNAKEAQRSSYDKFNAPTSAYYTNSVGRFGSHYVGD